MTENQLYPLTFELANKKGFPVLQVNYDSEGLIGAIFTRNEVLDTMIKADIEAFQEYNPSAFAVIQTRVYHELSLKGDGHVSKAI